MKERGSSDEGRVTRGESEFEGVTLTESDSNKVTAPGVKEAPINLECRYQEEFRIADSFLLVGEVVNIAGKEGALKEGRINLEEFGAVGHIGGEEFCVVNKVTRIERD